MLFSNVVWKVYIILMLQKEKWWKKYIHVGSNHLPSVKIQINQSQQDYFPYLQQKISFSKLSHITKIESCRQKEKSKYPPQNWKEQKIQKKHYAIQLTAHVISGDR